MIFFDETFVAGLLLSSLVYWALPAVYRTPFVTGLSLLAGKSRVEGLWAHMNAGSQAFVDGNYQLAVVEFGLATENHPDDSRSWQSLGMALAKVGDSDGSVTAYQKSLELNEQNAVAHHELAQLLIGKDHQDAEVHMIRAIEIDPQMIAAQLTLARHLGETGRIEQALNRYQTVIALDPQSVDLILERAELQARSGDIDGALSSLEAAADTISNDPSIPLSRALMLADAGRFSEAETSVQQVLVDADTDVDRAKAHYSLGRIHILRALCNAGNTPPHLTSAH